MVVSGSPTPLGGAQSVPDTLMQSDSGLLGGQGGFVPSQSGFSSIVSSRNQFGSMNMLGNVSDVSSLLHQSFGNGGPSSSLSGPRDSQRGLADNATESDPFLSVGNGMGFNTPSSFVTSNMVNPNSGHVQVQQLSNSSRNHLQNFQRNQQPMQRYSALNNDHYQQQPHYQSVRGGLGGVGPVKMETHVTNDQHGETSQQLQRLRNLGPVKLEPEQIQTMRGLAPLKMEPQHSDQSLYLHQEQKQQQQQLLHISKQSPQAAAHINLLHQQRLLQHPHQHQQQQLKVVAQQRSPIQPQFQQQNLSMRSPAKPVYEPGMCAGRLTHYMYQQQHRPEDNNIEFWRKFVAEYFAPHAKKKWCVSKYGSGRQTTGVSPQDVWHCEICNRKPGRGFEATVEVLPRLFKIKYESGTLEELLYVDMPREYQNSSGQIILDFAKAIQHSVFEQLRVVRDGKLRIVFSPELKICSWEFCTQHHEELIPRRALMPQVSQLGATAQKYQVTTQAALHNLSVPELQNNCNMFVASARQLAKALEVPLVNDLGYSKRYVRCLQISEVVNSMKDLIDYSREFGTGPMESLVKFPRGTSTSVFNGHTQQDEQQQTMAHIPNKETYVQATAMQLASTTGMQIINNSFNSAPTTSSTSTIAGVLHQNSTSFRVHNLISNANSPYGGNGVQIPSPGSSGPILQAQPNPSPFQSPTPSPSNNMPQTSSNSVLIAAMHMNSVSSPNISMQQPVLSGDLDTNDSQSSVQKILHEILMSSQLGGGGMVGVGSFRDNMKSANTLFRQSNATVHSGSNGHVANGMTNNNSGMGTAGLGGMGGGLGQAAIVNGIRGTTGNNVGTMNGRVGMTTAHNENINQQDMGLLIGVGTAAGFSNVQFDWKASP